MDPILQLFNETRNDAESVERSLQRDKLKTESPSNPFLLTLEERNYDEQYFHLYQHRLQVLGERVTRSCEKKWDSNFELNHRRVVKKNKVLDIQSNEPCWCVGTIYCEMKYKPNVLEEVVNDVYGAPDLVRSYADAEGSDEIMLEDESGRVLLVGDFVKNKPFVSGTVVGILGMEADAGAFQVLDICYPAALPQECLPKSSSPGKVAFVSGLNSDPSNANNALRIQLLQEYLTGNLVDASAISKIGRLVICGNSLRPSEPSQLSGCLAEFGTFMGNILQSIPIDLMPGPHDPSDQCLPQQPLHKALFADAVRPFFNNKDCELLSPTTNPAWLKFNGIELLGTSGQNIDDICKYVIANCPDPKLDPDQNEDMVTRLNMMEGCLKWQNIAPTAPDTLWCYPYKSDDPFILSKLPHVYFVGNQPAFASKSVTLEGDTEVKVVAVPDFSSTGQIVILDLQTLKTDVVTIQI
ncbi:LADA_0D10968g1_1 [Lachancea dasiensis]|uniref:DNA-directed DNA polymerase n=1 Tax=Lachancea dasiensis TaxID=1072105 RepID=A0A1G4J7S2_9SACH|nr:LADA_0D10968g1_1 [Lachancea dasiensis]